VERGDVIVSVDGQTFADSKHPAQSRRGYGAGHEPHPRSPARRPAHDRPCAARRAAHGPGRKRGGGEHRARKLGLQLEPLSPERAQALGLDVKHGLLVAGVAPSGPAADAGFRPGDVIQEVNHKPVTDVDA